MPNFRGITIFMAELHIHEIFFLTYFFVTHFSSFFSRSSWCRTSTASRSSWAPDCQNTWRTSTSDTAVASCRSTCTSHNCRNSARNTCSPSPASSTRRLLVSKVLYMFVSSAILLTTHRVLKFWNHSSSRWHLVSLLLYIFGELAFFLTRNINTKTKDRAVCSKLLFSVNGIIHQKALCVSNLVLFNPLM